MLASPSDQYFFLIRISLLIERFNLLIFILGLNFSTLMESHESDTDSRSNLSENRSCTGESNVVLIKELEHSSTSSASSDSSDDEAKIKVKTDKKDRADMNSVYAHVQKLIRYLKVSTYSLYFST